MCKYIKDDDEQCGIDSHDGDFCHQHDDTAQAALHEHGQKLFDSGDVPTGGQFAQLIADAVTEHVEKTQTAEEAESDAQSDASRVEGVDTCGSCEAAVRTDTRLREHPNKPRSVVVQFYLHCDCGGYVLTEETVSKTEIPWVENGRGGI